MAALAWVLTTRSVQQRFVLSAGGDMDGLKLATPVRGSSRFAATTRVYDEELSPARTLRREMLRSRLGAAERNGHP